MAAPELEGAEGVGGHSVIADWFRGRSILVTGATGFMGKVLVEKLLRSCPDLAAIFVLVRDKRGSDARARLDQLLAAPIFDGLRRDRPDALRKVVPVVGDLTQPRLGIGAAERRAVAEAVSVVFHCAATVKFDEKIKLSVEMNVEGTRRLVDLCREMSRLESLVHVSTAYANCPLREVAERVYPPPADPERVAAATKWMDDETLDSITPKMLGEWPNTYTYTKALAEHVLAKEAADLPAAILRPSIVTAAWREPIPGWVDNLNGPTGLLAGAGKGILRTLLCHRNLVADVVPVDICINMLIAVAWHTAVAPRPREIPVYNCTSGTTNPVLWGDIERLGQEFLLKNPFTGLIWYPGGSFKSSRLANWICDTTMQMAPAYLIDAGMCITGRKPIMVRIHEKITRAVKVLEYFTTNEWLFESKAAARVAKALPPADRARFPFDVRHVEWRPYFEAYVLGTRRFILKEDPASLPAARQQLRKMYALHIAAHAAALLLLGRVLLLRSPATRRAAYELLTLAQRLGRFLWPL